MEKRESYKRFIKFLSNASLILMLTIIYGYVWFVCYTSGPDAPIPRFWFWGNFVLLGLYALMMSMFYQIYGGFKIGYLRLLETLYAQIISLLCVNVIIYLQLCLIGNLKFLSFIEPIVYMTAVDIIIIIIWGFVTQKIFRNLYPPREMVLIYGKYNPKYLLQKISSRKDKFSIVKIISINEDIDYIKAQILEYRCALFADIPAERRNALLKFCFENSIRCYTVPKISDIMIMSAENIHIFDTSLLLLRNKGLTVEQEFIKRIFDVVVSFIALILLSPVMLLIALAIKLYDGGPVFFTQERLTKDGKLFKLIKFRSMLVNDCHEASYLTRKNDDRVTPIGKVIRALHLDELPQLINILQGDMSIVGPRPERPDIAEDYSKLIPEFHYRLKVKAGLTGFAQVYGKYNTTPYDKLKLDLTYIEQYSFLLDIKMILLTLKILFLKSNTEGIEDWQTNAILSEEYEKQTQK